MKNIARKCENCEFFKLMSEDVYKITGRCRRYPPVFTNDSFRFAVIDKYEWCGEHRYSKQVEDIIYNSSKTKIANIMDDD